MPATLPSVPLREVITERQEAPSDDALASGRIRIVSKIGFNDGKIQLRSDNKTKTGMILVRPGDLLVSGINAAKGAIAICGEENNEAVAATIHYGAYVPNNDRVDARYLWWLLRSYTFRALLLKHVPGGIKTELKAKRLLPIPIPLPPLEEQRRIVVRIDELATKIEDIGKLKRLAIGETDILWASYARKLFSALDDAVIQPLRSLVIMRGGGTPSKANPFFWKGSIPLICPKDMKSREIVDATDHISENAIHSSSAKLIEPGAVLIVVRGMILAHTVPSAVLRKVAAINQDMKALIPNQNLMPRYLCNVMWAMNNQMLTLVEKSSHDTRRLQTERVLDFTIPVPPLSEQRRIVSCLEDFEKKVNTVKQFQVGTAAEMEDLLPSVLDKAFKGEL